MYLLGDNSQYVNAPGLSWSELDVTKNAAGFVVQEATSVVGSGKKWRSRSDTGNWSAWAKVMSEWDVSAAVVNPPYAVTTNTASGYAANYPDRTIYTLSAGLRITIKTHAASTGPITLTVDGLEARPIKKHEWQQSTFGLWRGVHAGLRWLGFLSYRVRGEYGTAIASEVLAGKTIGTESGLLTGTMVNNGAGGTVTPSRQPKPNQRGTILPPSLLQQCQHLQTKSYPILRLLESKAPCLLFIRR